jgi:hypothetical protein
MSNQIRALSGGGREMTPNRLENRRTPDSHALNSLKKPSIVPQTKLLFKSNQHSTSSKEENHRSIASSSHVVFMQGDTYSPSRGNGRHLVEPFHPPMLGGGGTMVSSL